MFQEGRATLIFYRLYPRHTAPEEIEKSRHDFSHFPAIRSEIHLLTASFCANLFKQYWIINPLNPNSDEHENSLYITHYNSNIQVMRIKGGGGGQ